ncbi:MAG TPA: DUF222 domain-containing protein [Streptosporangiaceae bacterium]|nr:DUF222 domain-containing protein [Streptosporangiaceae bacterium]
MPQEGLAWSWGLDFEALLAALSEPAPWNRSAAAGPADRASGDSGGSAAMDSATADATPAGTELAGTELAGTELVGTELADQAAGDPAEAELAELIAAIDEGRSRVVPLTAVAGRIAETLPTGPDLAGWLATSSVDSLEDGALAGMAASYRRLASWAQAGELAVVAQMASRSAAADDKIGVDEQGRPARVSEEACAQVSLALTMSQASASWWSDLGVTLTWRLAATGAALRAGQIDVSRARMIAEATGALDDETARAVEARVLPAAGDQTTAQLRAALRRAVIAADPQGAERRRQEAERRAKVCLYPDAEGTASLAGYSLPGVRAAAAMARISALARALRASGAGGGIDLLRAQVFLGLLLGTLPYIPPAADGPTDDEPPDDPFDQQHDGPHGGESPDDSASPGKSSGGRRHRSGSPEGGHSPSGRTPTGRPGDGDSTAETGSATRSFDSPRPGEPNPGEPGPGGPEPGGAAGTNPTGPGPAGLSRSYNWAEEDEDDDDTWLGARPPPAWPGLTAFLPPAPPAMGNLRPMGGGLLDLRLPWTTLVGESAEPGYLARMGPITPAQARYLADLAACDAAVQWRVIVTGRDGRTLAVARVPREPVHLKPARQAAPARSAAPAAGGLVRRVTVTVSQDTVSQLPTAELSGILARVLRTAARAADHAVVRTAADATATGGCAHTEASLAYRPPPRLLEYVAARDLTCRFPTCRQPAWRCDLDHTRPYDQGGRTCSCNLGGLCRFHHQLKQHVRWQLTQPTPGTFIWTTPAGRTYTTQPDTHAA